MKLTLLQCNHLVTFNKQNINKIYVTEFGILNLIKFNKLIKTISTFIDEERQAYTEVLKKSFEDLKTKHPDNETVIIEFFSCMNDMVKSNELLNREDVALIKNELIAIANELNYIALSADSKFIDVDITFDKEKFLSAIEKANIESVHILAIDFLFE
jgi:hypothetical protein